MPGNMRNLCLGRTRKAISFAVAVIRAWRTGTTGQGQSARTVLTASSSGRLPARSGVLPLGSGGKCAPAVISPLRADRISLNNAGGACTHGRVNVRRRSDGERQCPCRVSRARVCRLSHQRGGGRGCCRGGHRLAGVRPGVTGGCRGSRRAHDRYRLLPGHRRPGLAAGRGERFLAHGRLGGPASRPRHVGGRLRSTRESSR